VLAERLLNLPRGELGAASFLGDPPEAPLALQVLDRACERDILGAGKVAVALEPAEEVLEVFDRADVMRDA